MFGYIFGKPKIAYWNTYYPNIKSESKSVKKFYDYRVRQIEIGEYIDLGENLSYAFYYIYQQINALVNTKDIINYVDKMKHLLGLYQDTKLKYYIIQWLEDGYNFVGDYVNASRYAQMNKYIRISDILHYGNKIPDFNLSGMQFIDLFGKKYLTKYGRDNIEPISLLIDLFLKDFQFIHGKDFISYFCKDLNYDNPVNIFTYKDYFVSEDEFLRYKSIDDQLIGNGYKSNYVKENEKYLFSGVPIKSDEKRQLDLVDLGITIVMSSNFGEPIKIHTNTVEPGSVIENALSNEAKRIIRESENTHREECGIPKIGEGWVSETDLFYKVKEYFYDYDVIHHGRPEWLGRQHLDIYFKDVNIGIEYQGTQHQQPVDYFGGEEAYNKQKQRDKKKLNKCKLNNCHLIYVYEGYIFNDIVVEILSILEAK